MKGKQKAGSKRQVNTQALRTFLIVGLFSIIFMLPFFRGLFFTTEILTTHIVSFSLFIAYLIYKKLAEKTIVIQDGFDYVGFFMVIAYILPILFGQWANLRSAVGEVLKMMNVLVIYLMAKDFMKDEGIKKKLLTVLVLSGLVTALIGIGSVAGLFQLEDAVLAGNRISSTFQYPNTLAAFMMTLFFLAFILMEESEKLWQKVAYGAIGFTLFFTFIFTYSRAAWLLFPAIGLIYILVLPGKKRVHALLYVLIVALPSIFSMQPFTSALEGDAEIKIQVLVVYFSALVGFAVIHLLLEGLKQRLQDRHYRYIYGLFLVVAIGAGVLFNIAIKTTQPLVFDNTAADTHRTNQIIRTVTEVEPATAYRLSVDVETEGTLEEGQWPWRIQVISENQESTRETLLDYRAEADLDQEKTLEFETAENTQNLLIYFSNYHAGGKAIFNRAVLANADDNQIKDIKLSYRYIPESIIGRFNSIDLDTTSSSMRLTYYQDGLKIFKQNPLVGAGGGAWNALYPLYQSEPYYSTEPHNYLIQTMTDLGSVGVGLLLFMVCALVLVLVRSIKEKHYFNITLVVAIFSLLGHSLLDFNLSFLSVKLILWILLASIEWKAGKASFLSGFGVNIPAVIAALVFVPVLIGSFLLQRGNLGNEQALAYAREGRRDLAVEQLQQSVKLDPFNDVFRLHLATLQTQIASERGDGVLIQEAESHLLKARRYAPTQVDVVQGLTNVYVSMGDFQTAFDLAEEVLQLAPYRQATYDIKLNAHLSVGNYYAELGQLDLAAETFTGGIQVVADLYAANQLTEKPMRLSHETMETINRCKFFAENANDLSNLSNLQALAFFSSFDIDVNDDQIPDDWWTWNRTLPEQQSLRIDSDGIAFQNREGARFGLHTPDFSLQPGTQYTVTIQFSEDTAPENARIRILSRSGTGAQHTQDAFEQGVNTFIFETTEDIQAGNQYLILEHKGADNQPLSVESIYIYN